MYYLSLSIYIHTEIQGWWRWTQWQRVYFRDSGVDGHDRSIRNSHSFFPSSWSHQLLPIVHRSTQFAWFLTHSCQVFLDARNLCGSSWLGIPSNPVTLFLHSSSQNGSVSRILFKCHARGGGVVMTGCLASSSTVSPHNDQVNLVMHSEAVMVRNCRLLPSEFGDTLGGRDRPSVGTHFEAVIVQTSRL